MSSLLALKSLVVLHCAGYTGRVPLLGPTEGWSWHSGHRAGAAQTPATATLAAQDIMVRHLHRTQELRSSVILFCFYNF